MSHETLRRPTHGLPRAERLVRERAELIKAMPALLMRYRGEQHEQSARNPDKSARVKIRRIVERIRAISQEIGPARR